MVNHYKKIVLLFGLEYINDYNFRVLKSLLIHDLKLTKKMQDDYDRIKIADLMEEKFPEDAGLNKLIEVFEDIPELGDRVDILWKEMEKVKNKTKIKSESSTPPLTSNMKIWEAEPAMKTSSSKESKDTISVSPDIMTTQFGEEEPNIPELSATSTYPAECEPLTPQEFPTTASSLQTPLEPPKISSTILATSQASSAPCPTHDKASHVSPVTVSSSIQTIQPFQKTSTLSCSHQATLESPKADPSGVQTFRMTPATMTSGHNCPQVPAAAVASRFNKPQVTPATLPSSVQAPWMPQATVASSVQTLRMTTAKMTGGCNAPQVPAATGSNSHSTPQITQATVPSSAHSLSIPRAALPSSVQTLRMTTAKRTSGCNSPQVSGSRVPVNYSTPQMTQATVPSSSQNFQMTIPAVTSDCKSPQVSGSRVPVNCNNPHVTPARVTSSVQTLRMTTAKMTSGCNSPQVSGSRVPVSYSTPQMTPATVPSSSQNFQMTIAAMTSGCKSPQVSGSREPASYNNPPVTPATVPSSAQTFGMTSAAMTSGCNSPQISIKISRVPVSYSTPQITQATVPSSSQNFQMTIAAMTSGYKSPQVSGSRVPVSYNNPPVTPATVPSSAQTFGMTSAAMTSGCNNPQVSAATVSSSYSNAPQVSSATMPRSFSAMPVSPEIPLKKPRLKNVPKQPSEEDGHQQGSKQVMVLKATDPFTYDMTENKRMFHATVATETEFFRVKVFDIALRNKFTPRKVIVISHYKSCNGFLEIDEESSVTEVDGNNVMNIPSSLIKSANATPKINTLCKQEYLYTSGKTFVNGIFTVYMKTVKSESINYGIEDKTGRMEVVVSGQFANMHCKPGDKLSLFCFELSYSLDTWQLRSVRHSFMQVIQARRRDHEPPNLDTIIETAQTPHSWIPEQQW